MVNHTTMQDDGSLFPFEFAVAGTPLSLRASNANKAVWIAKVAAAAMDTRNEACPMAFLDDRPLCVTLLYFPAAPMDGDVDNIVKPVLDAMKAIVYPDDRVIERVVVQKFEPQAVWIIDSPSERLAAVLDMVTPVLYIHLDDSLAWRTIG